MIITKQRESEYMAVFKGIHAYGYTPWQAIINLLILL